MTWDLHHGDQHAVVQARGGRLLSYSVGGRSVLAGQERPGQPDAFRGALLAPWPNRVAGGRWEWSGNAHQLPINDPATGAALHGLVCDAWFTPVATSTSRVELQHALTPSSGYPFPLLVQASYALGVDGLSCRLTALNTGSSPAPVGLGAHGYVDAAGPVDDLVVDLPVGTELVTDHAWQEKGRVPADLIGPTRLGDRALDTAFTDLTGTRAVVIRPDGLRVVLHWGDTTRWLVAYTADTVAEPDRRRSLAIEPQTCPPNALASGKIDVITPGDELALTWRYEAG